MSEIPLAPLRRIMKKNGVERISKEGLKAFEKAVAEYANHLAQESHRTAEHAGRKTVTESDIDLLLELTITE